MDINKSSIIYLNRSQLEPHPDNPRKDLGDLEELRESIREHGIMQNLTVIPTDDTLEHFRILIGHRRFAASEGILTELPCVMVEDLTDREQVGIMLMENMQRTDLTYIEQAHGFQLMLDLGDNAPTVLGGES
jgi:ParB family chromosome partitioning protein